MRSALLLFTVVASLACGREAHPRDAVVAERLSAWGAEAFSEEAESQWRSRSLKHEGAYSVVEAEPVSARIGYERARFVVHWPAEDAPRVIACMAYDGKAWVQLFEDAEAPEGWRERTGTGQ